MMTNDEREAWAARQVKEVHAGIDARNCDQAKRELKELATHLIGACADFGATDWDRRLHLATVFEKHFMQRITFALQIVDAVLDGDLEKARRFVKQMEALEIIRQPSTPTTI